MAQFLLALQKVLTHEGGYVNDPNDPGGETYKGIARKMQSAWCGWELIDNHKQHPAFPSNLEKDTQLQGEVTKFYHQNFWDTINGDKITDQKIAESIFDFGVNVGVKKSASLAQKVVGANPDGIIGPITLGVLNSFNVDHFLAAFTVEKITYYAAIVHNKPSSKIYFYGWVLRALGTTPG